MMALFLKDLLSQKGNVVFGAFYSLIFFVGFALVGKAPFGGFVYVFCGVAVGYIVLFGSFGADRNDTSRFVLSMPVTRRDAVNGKFLLLLGAAVYGVVSASLFGAVTAALSPATGVPYVSPMHLLRTVGGVTVLSFILPFYFKFGHRMMRYLLLSLAGLGIVAQVVLMYVLSRSGAGQEGQTALVGKVVRFFESSGDLVRNLWFVGVGLAVLITSYLVCLRIATRQDL